MFFLSAIGYFTCDDPRRSANMPQGSVGREHCSAGPAFLTHNLELNSPTLAQTHACYYSILTIERSLSPLAHDADSSGGSPSSNNMLGN